MTIGPVDRLHVWLDDHLGLRHVGILSRTRESGFAYQSNVAFAYDRALRQEDAISLLMPVTNAPYTMPFAGMTHILPPVFDQNLPEGALRQHLVTMFAKIVPDMGDFELLGLLGEARIGRIRVTQTPTPPSVMAAGGIDATLLLRTPDSRPLMLALIEKLAKESNVSGVQPKVLARANVEHDAAVDRLTMTADQLIVKSSGDDYPWLAVNEFLCMKAATALGLRVPVVHLSEDQQVLVVEGFDFDHEGNAIGFEDMACLSARMSNQRYEGSYEDVVQTIRDWVTPDYLPDALDSFFAALVFNCAIENGDAHLKNFGLIYRDPTRSVALAPVYDLVCTTAYLREDQMALRLRGSSRFADRAALERFGQEACGLERSEILLTFSKALMAIDDLSIQLANFSNADATFEQECGNAMMASLVRGMRRTFGLGKDYFPSGYHLTLRATRLD